MNALRHTGIEWLQSILAVVQVEDIPNICRKITLTLLYKQVGDHLYCNNYSGSTFSVTHL